MNHYITENLKLRSIVWPANNSTIKQISLILFGILLLSISAQIVIPLEPVPLTLQSVTVVFLGMLYGPRLGVISVMGYLLAGTVGLPLYAEFSSGAGVLLGTTAGYLFGFIPAVLIGGYLAQCGFARNILLAFISACLSASVIFFFGILVLSKFIGMHQAILTGLMPFVATETLKMLAVSIVIPRCWKKA